MASKLIGVEIGNHTVKLAVCQGGVIKDMAVERMPDNLVSDGKINSPNATSELIRDICRRNGIRSGACALVLPPSAVMAHMVSIPVMNEAELKLNLPFEFKDFVGKESAKYDYDYSVIGVKDNIMQIYAAAVRKDVVEEYYDILRKAGLTLKVATPVEMAWLNLIRASKNAPSTLCVVDVGHKYTSVNIFSHGHFEMGRQIEIAGEHFDKLIADSQQIDIHVARTHKEANMDNVLASGELIDAYAELSVEVMRIVNFYGSSSENSKELNDIYYCGGSSFIESLRTAILKRTDLTMHHISRLLNAPDIDDDSMLYCALAAGAALQPQ